MLSTADGYEFTIGAAQWEATDKEWTTLVTIIDGDKRMRLNVVTPAHIKPAAVAGCVQKSMEQWSFRGERTMAKPLKGGV